MSTEVPRRKVQVLVPTEKEMSEVKKGDIFKIIPASPDDTFLISEQLYKAESDAFINPEVLTQVGTNIYSVETEAVTIVAQDKFNKAVQDELVRPGSIT